MKSKVVAGCALLALWIAPLTAQEEGGLLKKVQENPNSVELIQQYGTQTFQKATQTMRSDPDKALKLLEEFEASLSSLAPEDAAAKGLLNSARNYAGMLKQRIALQKTSMEELIQKLEANPKDVPAISLYGEKVMMEAGPMIRTEPDKADAIIVKAKEMLAKLREKAQGDDNALKAIDGAEQALGRIESQIASAKRLIELIGQDAAPFAAEAWVNGGPYTDADLKGKVVMLDFWAIWCGPCIATFPHLREWQEKYADKGLVIIGLTQYYNFKWDEESEKAAPSETVGEAKADGTAAAPARTGRAPVVRAEEPVTPEAEQEMLKRFAEFHNLHHAFAVQKDETLSEFYGVTGIPHVVVIDREGKVRMIKVGSGDENAKAIGALLEELVGS